MSEVKFTQGPWRISLNNGCKVWSKDKLIACVKMPQHCFSSHNSTADADLISMAPEMYQELERDLNEQLKVQKSIEGKLVDEWLNRSIDRKQNLLAKARGE